MLASLTNWVLVSRYEQSQSSGVSVTPNSDCSRWSRIYWPENLHWHWLAVSNWLDWITATQCCTAFHPAASRYFSERRTMQPVSSSRLHDVLVPGHYCGSCTGCPFNTESSTRSLCWPSKAAAAPQHRHTSLGTSRLASVNGYFAPVPHHYWTSRSPERTLQIEPFAALL